MQLKPCGSSGRFAATSEPQDDRNFVRTVISLRRHAPATEGSIADFAPIAAAATFRPLTLKVPFYNGFAGPVPSEFLPAEFQKQHRDSSDDQR